MHKQIEVIMSAAAEITMTPASPSLPKPIEAQSSRYFTDAKIKRAALYVFAAIAVLAGVAVITLSALSIVAWPVALVSIPLFAASAYLLYRASQIKDYEDPVELQQMRQQALNLSFTQLLKEHTLENIQKYQIVSHELLQQKFQEETQFDSFLSIIRKYTLRMILIYDLVPLENLRRKFAQDLKKIRVWDFNIQFSLSDLSRYDIITEEQYRILSDLCTHVDEQDRQFHATAAGIDLKYVNRQERLLDRLHQKSLAAHKRAQERTEAVRKTGYAATEVAVAFQDPHKKPEERWRDQWRTRLQGEAITELAAIPASAMSNHLLQQELDEIASEKRRIQENRIGLDEQIAYNQEMALARRSYDAEISPLNARFQSFALSLPSC
jgi:hypothetical protein